MLKRYIKMMGIVQYCHGESSWKEEFDEASMPRDTMSSWKKGSSVRIIHAGGIVELYQGVIRAAYVMEKYPRMCVARPEVFIRPHESIIGPEEELMPGQKFYLIPCSTVKKLRKKHPEKLQQVGGEKEMFDGEDTSDESICSAKDFFVSRERWSRCFLRRMGGNEQEKKVFTPPIKKARIWQGLAWQPSLDSVEELSP
ncbi:uncharacterized protein LOC131246146 [Magnolia sinica]|uniref:uncharacterized protein LOC131246146 n=1 Tax=Magnolia sinica TaxID=86752 RepID=UPI0026580CC0|nr:uncharacterized protein LOC131246146 [Magnolia sinica]